MQILRDERLGRVLLVRGRGRGRVRGRIRVRVGVGARAGARAIRPPPTKEPRL